MRGLYRRSQEKRIRIKGSGHLHYFVGGKNAKWFFQLLH